MTIKIEEGKYYKTRDGIVVGPLIPVGHKRRKVGYAYTVSPPPEGIVAGNVDWTDTGKFISGDTYAKVEDLVEEVPAPCERRLTAEERTVLGAEIVKEAFKRAEERRISKAKDIAALGAEIVKETFKRVEEKRLSKADLLDKAKEAVADRGLNYGKPEDNFARIAAFWNVYLRSAGVVDRDVFGPADVAQMMVLMKMARIQNQPDHLDSWVDIAGYAACGAEISCGS